MALKNFFSLFFVMIIVLSSSVFADQLVSVNQDASAAKNIVCDVIQSPTDLGYAFSWFKNGKQVILNTNQLAIDASQLTKGDNWKCEAWKETSIAGTLFIGSDSAVILNSAPVIVPSSALITLNGVAGVPFSYDVNAVDVDAEVLSYSLSAITPAAAILINKDTGLLTWFNPVAGTYTFSVTASDSGYGATSTTQNYRLVISGTVPPISNNPPSITSTAVTSATAALLYNYDVNAVDLDGNTLTYSLTTFPAGMTINSATGLISWTPAASQVGSNNAVVSVTDGFVAVTQPFAVIVAALGSNSITFSTSSCPDAELGKSYTCDIDASGVGTLQYSLVSNLTNMTINANTGVVSWTPSNSGTFTFTVRVTDVTNSVSRDQSYTVSVSEVTAEDASDFVFIDSITFDKETYSPGETAIAYVAIRNEEDIDVDDLKIELLMQDSGIKATSAKFDLIGNGKKTIKVSLDLPNTVSSSSEWVKVTLIGENIRIARYRAIEYSGVSGDSNKAELVVKPTSLPGYSAGNQEQKLNWVGVWFVAILFLLLLGLAAYIVKRMAEEKDNKVRFTNLDGNYLGEVD